MRFKKWCCGLILQLILEVCNTEEGADGSATEAEKLFLNLKLVARRQLKWGAYKSYLVVGSTSESLLWVDRYYMPIEGDKYGQHVVTGYFEIEGTFYEYDNTICMVTSRFKVYQMRVTDDGKMHFLELGRLDGETLFLGHNRSESISTSDHVHLPGNRIYYMDDYIDSIEGAYQTFGAINIGVFDIKDQRTRP